VAPISQNEEPEDVFEGICQVCGREGVFEMYGKSVRETYRCVGCKALLRDQGQARVTLDLYSRRGVRSISELVNEQNFQTLAVYEPGVLGPFRTYFEALTRYTTSAYWTDVEPGQYRDGIQCQDLMALTYPDDHFDLVVTSDIFEHVRHPYKAFGEVRRVLKPGGAHIFSIPVLSPMPEKSISRVDTSGPEDVLLMPARYHGGGGARYLVYTDFGADLLEALSDMGLETLAVRYNSQNENLRRLITFYSVAK
jgi:SAM-dependent methyltransferase